MFSKPIRITLQGILVFLLAFSTLGAARLPLLEDVEPGVPVVQGGAAGRFSSVAGECPTQTVRITLASEQVDFCAPASLPFSVVEDDVSDQYVSYAGLNQRDGYGTVNIKATAAGYASGPGRPVYYSGDATEYRQAVWEIESTKTDRIVSSGPTGFFWNETAPSIQIDLSLPLSTSNVQVRSIEWYVVHNNRLWSFVITWNTVMQNASEWEMASKNMSVKKAEEGNSAAMAVDLGAAFLESQRAGGISSYGAPVVVGPPAWWDGDCNYNNFIIEMGVPSYPLGASWLGVKACGPKNSMHPVQFFPGAWGELEFQCVELVMRFLYLQWGIAPWAGNANQIKNSPPESVVFYPNNGVHGIVPGDIITEDASVQNSAGHTVVVTGVSVNSTGTGTVTILEQNASSSGLRVLTVTDWQVQPDAYCYGQTIQGWLHTKGNQDDGDIDATFTPGTGPDGQVNAIAVKPSGKILIAGEFGKFNGISVNRIARLYSDGTLDTGYNPVGVAGISTPHVYALVVYSDGKALIGGQFDHYNNTGIKNIARLNGNGSLDTTFSPASEVNGDVYKIVIVNPNDQSSKILVGGEGLLLRLNSNGTLDKSFAVDRNVFDIAVQTDGKIIIAGDFSSVDGTPSAGIARIKSDNSLDASFDIGTGTGVDAVRSISLDPDGKVLIGGTFTTYNGTARNKVARLNSNGWLDASFDPGTGISGSSEYVRVILAQTDGKVVIGGNFTSFNGSLVNHIGRLNYNGSRDADFPASLDGLVQSLILQPDEKIIAGGDFTNHVARLYNHIESCYTLTTHVNPDSAGDITVDSASNCPGGQYLSGTQVQLTANPNPDYWLVNWSGDASGTTNPLIMTMDGNKTVTANLMASPGIFSKSSPENGAIDKPAELSLNWGTSLGASSYEYCLYTTNKDDCDFHPWISTGTSTSATLSNLFPSFTYHWQVRARNLVDTTDGGPWWSFTRDGFPAIPLPISPGGIIIDPHPPYVWKVSNGASSYRVTVYSISASANVIDEPIGPSACSAGVCTYHPSMELPLGDYEFRVAATAVGTSTSPWRSFSVGVGLFLPLIPSSN